MRREAVVVTGRVWCVRGGRVVNEWKAGPGLARRLRLGEQALRRECLAAEEVVEQQCGTGERERSVGGWQRWSFWRALRRADPGKHRLSQNELAEMRRSASNISGPPGAQCGRAADALVTGALRPDASTTAAPLQSINQSDNQLRSLRRRDMEQTPAAAPRLASASPALSVSAVSQASRQRDLVQPHAVDDSPQPRGAGKNELPRRPAGCGAACMSLLFQLSCEPRHEGRLNPRPPKAATGDLLPARPPRRRRRRYERAQQQAYASSIACRLRSKHQLSHRLPCSPLFMLDLRQRLYTGQLRAGPATGATSGPTGIPSTLQSHEGRKHARVKSWAPRHGEAAASRASPRASVRSRRAGRETTSVGGYGHIAIKLKHHVDDPHPGPARNKPPPRFNRRAR
ncbi:hypothetical protein B0J12DRAFT_266339 [Macrophomina phaseolina]|uniref:Uncharacterized protein n=1 Tax=Macrophomina phaseolina TaxID=35725 RepID=A0ABQ8FYT1_9PEZI|nr:hypothetical protein B0J12DRAFT_266339 [Macrophomina phaseolina]